MKKILVLLSAVLVLASCGRRVLIDDMHQFANDTWLRFEPETFEFDVDNIDEPYLVTVALKYDTTRLTDVSLPLVVEFFADSNARHTIFPVIRLVGRDGKRLGTTVDRYCTVTDTLDRCRLYNEKGRFTYRLKQRTSKYEIGGINGLGLKVEKL
ncbi:MAG: lipoprotein [Bacteroidales bacterium]|nr:lipoprotein [Bacteroidales bacterium]